MTKSHIGIFKRNMGLLQTYHPHIYTLIKKVNGAFNGVVTTVKQGHQAIQLQNGQGQTITLYDENSDETDISFVPDDFYGLIYLVGMGMGYTALTLVQQKPDMRFLAIFEPDPHIFYHVLHVTDLAPVLSDPRVIISIGADPDLNRVLAPARNALMTESLCYRKHLPSVAYDSAYETLAKQLFDYAPLYLISGGTLSVRGRLFFENRLNHFRVMHHHLLFERLKETFRDKPAILVGAGPSLNKNIRYLKVAKGKAVIICVDSALPALVHHNVIPDFVTTMDAYNFSYEKIADQAPYAKGISLICTPTVNVKAPKIFPADRVLWAFTENETDKWLNSISGGKTAIRGAETVAHLNLFSALTMGCSPIIFVGQDLAYTTSQSHAEHTFLSGRNVMEEDLRSENKVVWVKGVEGGEVPTSLAYYNMKRFFEEVIHLHPRHYINATEGGAHIAGTVATSLQQVIQEVCTHFIDVAGTVEKVVTSSPAITFETIQREIGGEIEKISHLSKVLDETLALTKSILQDFEGIKKTSNVRRWTRVDDLPKSIVTRMKKSDKLNGELDQALDVWGKLTEITIECLKYSERMNHEMNRLQREEGRFLDWLIQREKRLAYINQFRKKVLDNYLTHLKQVEHTHDLERAVEKSAEDFHGRIFNLAVYYFNGNDLVLAKPIFQQLEHHEDVAKEACFYLGCIALHQGEIKRAHDYFARAESMDSGMAERARAYCSKLGDEYFDYSIQPNYDKAASRRLLLKGIRYCPWHEKIIDAINTQFDDDFYDSDSRIKDAPDRIVSVIDPWLKDFSACPELKTCLGHHRMAELYALYGRALMEKGSFEEAERKFSRALEHGVDNPYFHALIADAYLAQNKFNLGVMHLNKAVELDRSYGACWEDLGNALFSGEQYADALTTYEMCFKALPEKVECLKKMGDCYEKMGNVQAAAEAFRQYERLVGKP